jgi:N-acetylglucosamine kinase-like BadF-type ATPase
VWLGVEAVRAVVQALDGRGPETALTPTVAAELGVPLGAGIDVATRITDAVYSQSPAGLGTLAPHVVAAAEADDAVALGLVEDAVGHLTGTAEAAVGDEDPEVIVLGGSLLIGARSIGDGVRARLSERWPRSAMVEAASGEAGAVSLAIRAYGGTVTPRMLERLRVASAGSA